MERETVNISEMEVEVIRCSHLPPGTVFILTMDYQPCPFCIEEEDATPTTT